MSTWVCLIRGIGGGIRPLPMKELKTALEKIGLREVRTYIQSGNVVFSSSKATAAQLSKRVTACITTNFGFEPDVWILSVREFAQAAADNPYPKADAEPKSLHVFFLSERPKAPDIGGMNKLRSGSEAFALKRKVFYLYTPDGFATSRLAERAHKLLGVNSTARNWRTVCKVLAIAQRPL